MSPHPRRPNKTCLWCGQSYYPKNRSGQSFCSRNCAGHAQIKPKRPVSDRFWEKVVKTDGCWLWTGAHDRYGYGSIKTGGKTFKAYRVGYELQNGPITAGLHVCHRCDNPPCVRGDHLFLGTHADNVADMRAKGRMRLPKTQGEFNSQAKLTNEAVIDIVARIQRGDRQADIARVHGVVPVVIAHIAKGRSWTHVTGLGRQAVAP